MSEYSAACSHARVARKDNNTGGRVTKEWWECTSGCGTRFMLDLQKYAPSLLVEEPTAAESKAEKAHKKACEFFRDRDPFGPDDHPQPPSGEGVDTGKCGSCAHVLPDHFEGCFYRLAEALSEEEVEPESEETLDAFGSMHCDICKANKPHCHSAEDVEQERYCRPAFERYFESFLLRNYGGLDPAGTYGWGMHWRRRNFEYFGAPYLMPQVQVSWQTWKISWSERGSMFPELQAACRSAVGEASPLPSPQPVEEEVELPRLKTNQRPGEFAAEYENRLRRERERQLQASLLQERRLRSAVQVHSDSAVEAWNLTRKWQARVQELEPLQSREGLLRDALLALPVLHGVLEAAGLTGANIAYDMQQRITAALTPQTAPLNAKT